MVSSPPPNSAIPQSVPANSQTQIGAAYLAGARFDVAFNELRKGNFVPKHDKGALENQALGQDYNPGHGEL
jgi:farnesyl-diphosphate farnesyltransferase